jgi:hypothetical protein
MQSGPAIANNGGGHENKPNREPEFICSLRAVGAGYIEKLASRWHFDLSIFAAAPAPLEPRIGSSHQGRALSYACCHHDVKVLSPHGSY